MKKRIFESTDTNVKKFVFEWGDQPSEKKGVAEAVLYRYGEYRKRTVICCSVMSGCPVGCTFCGTGKFFVRNLLKNEIVEQVRSCLETIDCGTRDIEKFQIMFMSMGEPMLNWKELKLAIIELADMYPTAQLLISTSAPTGMIHYLGELISFSMQIKRLGLQFSVHESTDEARAKLIPTNTCTLRQIATMGDAWAAFTGRKPFFNYCVNTDNNGADDARRLASLFNPDVWECTLSVICEKDESGANSINRQLDIIEGFRKCMEDEGFHLRVFNPAGQDDIGGGCGQLWYFQKWLKEQE
jgi:23S rRNA (adenine2503-C2)-methyltransferase